MNNKRNIHRGFVTLEILGGLAVLAVIIVIAVSAVSKMFNKSTLNDEIANVQSLATQTRGMLKTKGEYAFTSAAKMTGTLIQFGGATLGMTINGEKLKGDTKMMNGWCGEVIVAPEKVQGSQNNKGFSITYKNVPQEACSVIATKLSSSTLLNEVSISGANNVGVVTAEKAATQCKPDNSSNSVNTLIFKSNN